MGSGDVTTMRLAYTVSTDDRRWVLDDDDSGPVTPLHDMVIRALVDTLRRWARRENRDALVGRNIAVRSRAAARATVPDRRWLRQRPRSRPALT